MRHLNKFALFRTLGFRRVQIRLRKSLKLIFRFAQLALLLSGLGIVGLKSSKVFAETPKPELSWIEEDGTDLPVDWRTASAWIWSRNRFALQLWIEIPRDLGEILKNVSNTDTEMQVTDESSLAPFPLSNNHVFLLIHMRSPSELIEVKSPATADVPAPQVRALKIELPFSTTTWMSNKNCRRFRPFLVERNHQGQPPLFLALDCRRELGTTESTIEIQGPKDVTLSTLPHAVSTSDELAGAESKLDTNILRVPLNKSSDQSMLLLARIEVQNLQNDSWAVFDLRRVASLAPTEKETEEFEEPVPQEIVSPTPHWRVGPAALLFESDNRGDSPSYSSVLSSGIFAGWRQNFTNPLSVIRAEALIPIGSPNLAWFRVLSEPAAWRKASVQGVFGLGGFRLGVIDSQYSSPAWVSPSAGFKVYSEKYRANWEAILSPVTLGSGSDGFGRVQLSLRSEIQVRKFETFSIDFFAEAFAIRTLGYDSNGWFANGLILGFQGEF